ncbi:MAG: hypothetical protein ACFE9C_10710, partial [Candidatus Hodarchaeota archaeon]
MFVLVLSHFDSIIGPMVFLNVPNLLSHEVLDEIPRLLDFYQEGFFIYEFKDLRTSNLIFKIPSPIARGREVNLMISIIIINDEKTDLNIFQETLEQFAHELKQIDEVYKVFESNRINSIDHSELSIKVEELLNSVYSALPESTISTEKKEINLVMFDFFEEGESQLLHHFRNYISSAQYAKDQSLELNLLNYKISLSTYSLSNPKKSVNFFLSQLKNKHGFIFAVDVTNKNMLRKARRISNKIMRLVIGKLNIIKMPCLILINKPGFYDFEVIKFAKYLDGFGYDIRTIKYIPTDTSNIEKIRDAFTWIINRIVKKYSKSN